ncbi:hypothetical protein HY633_02950, partial [Candidatus Uhrbacteria bacterium]|nr:hypothetical protein [Candidatus Uhrbacteria bacterium]
MQSPRVHKMNFLPERPAHSGFHHLMTVAALLFYFSGVATLFIAITGQINPAQASGPDSNRVLAYQLRLTDTSGTAVADGTKNIKIKFYTASTGGTPVHCDCGTTGTPV